MIQIGSGSGDHKDLRAARASTAVAAILLLAVTILLITDWRTHNTSANPRLLRGTVVHRQSTFVGPLRRPLLTIRQDETTTEMHAILMVNASSQIPDRVSFYLPASDAADVQLIEETSSLGVALVTGGLSLACAAIALFGSLFPGRRGRPR